MTKFKNRFYLFFLFFPVLAFAKEEKSIKIIINPTIHYQTIDGFGASDAWRCQFVGKYWPLEKRNAIADLLFSLKNDEDGNPKGIGLSIWRFNLSAGTAEMGDSSKIGGEWRRGECFQNPDGSYDWTKLAGQQWFLRAAKKRGVKNFLAFPNSPPVHMTNNGLGFATKGDTHFNLKAGMYDDYSRFMIDVMEHFEREGIHFKYLSPVNEPQWNWDGHSQEGTPASNEEIYALVKSLSNDLSKRGLTTKIVIGEAGTIGHVAMKMDTLGMKSDGRDDQARFFFNEDSPFYIGDLPNVEKTISAHSYFSVWPLDKQLEYRVLVNDLLKKSNPDLKYWMSEYCILQNNGEIGSGGGRDLTMKTALYVARIIHNDLVLTNATSWQWWTAISQCNFKDGLVYVDDGETVGSGMKSVKYDGRYLDSKLLWTLGNYSRFVRPGLVRIKCDIKPAQSVVDGVLVSAYKGGEDNLIVVLVNLSTDDKICNLGTSQVVDVFITSEKMNLERSRQNAASINIPARAVVTVLVNK